MGLRPQALVFRLTRFVLKHFSMSTKTGTVSATTVRTGLERVRRPTPVRIEDRGCLTPSSSFLCRRGSAWADEFGNLMSHFEAL